ncbi:hypothetical protein SLS56_007278 [Neofusicoccum ribis]|uniref:Uncharacterized protein n=1 Tax=Neofusicoccum ribis TaxID=45134 RepID=A0ABR3SNW6_9PEZI
MCCEEHHICLHCNTLIASHIDCCVAYHHVRNPGTEFGMAPADDWCPEEEWIVEEFLHADDGLCPHCAATTNLSSFPVDGLSGEVVHPPMALHGKGGRGGASTPSGSPTGPGGDGGSAGGRTKVKEMMKVAAAPRSGGGAGMGWRMRVRSIVTGTRLASKREHGDDDDSGDEPPTAVIREQVSADKRGPASKAVRRSDSLEGGAIQGPY